MVFPERLRLHLVKLLNVMGLKGAIVTALH